MWMCAVHHLAGQISAPLFYAIPKGKRYALSRENRSTLFLELP